MSGFLCVFDRSGAPLDRAICRQRLDAIADAGPDGAWLAFPHPWLAMGERVRRDAAEEPSLPAGFARQREGCTLVADARIDNREELRAAFGGRKEERSDADLLLDAYLAWGQACVDRLIGEFSFAVWDERERRLFCARDPMGDRTLYYAMTGGTLVLSNEIRVPRAWPGVDASVDELSVSAALVRRGLFNRDLERTFFQAVRQLPPGQRLFATAESLRTEAYWSMDDLAASPLPPAPLAERHEEFRALFMEAVTSRLRSAYPVGCHLSGGLDSTSVACVAAAALARTGDALPCFSHATRAPIPDISAIRTVRDERFIEAAAHQYPNIALHWAHGDERALLGELEANFHFTGIAHPNHFQTWWDEIHAQAQRAGLGTMLTGTSGNLTASWNGTTARRKRRSLRGSVRRLLAPVLDPLRPQAGSMLRPEVARRLHVNERVRAVATRLDANPRATSLGRGMNGLYRSYSIGRFGIELRDPMSDRRIVEFTLRAPDALFQRDGEQRLLIRDSLRGIVPDAVLDRRSRQLQSADWVERAKAGVPQLQRRLDALAACDLAASFIDLQRVRARMESLPANRGDMVAFNAWNNEVLHTIAIGGFLAWVAQGCQAPVTTPGSTYCQDGV